MRITVCIGSSCHLKGSREVAEKLQQLISEGGYGDKVEFSGAFCLGHCQPGVSVSIDDATYSVTPETVEHFFETEVETKL